MPEYIRVRQQATGHELTVTPEHADAVGGYDVLDKPATDQVGQPLPPKYHRSVDEAAQVRRPGGAKSASGEAATKPGQKADTKEGD